VDALTRTLTSGVHPAEIKSILAASKGIAEAGGELKRSSVLPLVRAAAMAGRHWAQGFLGLIKTSELRIGSYDYEKDLDGMLQELNARPRESDYIKDRLRTGQSVKQVLGHNRTVARTAAMNIYAKAALSEFLEDGLTLCRRMEVHDDRTSPICRVLNGTIHDIRKLLSYTFPLTHDSHPNCVLPDTIVSAGCDHNIVEGFVASYKGPVVKLILADGRRLSVTVNHMLLTPHGYMRAGDLREGSDVIGCSPGQWTRSINIPDNNNQPTRIQEKISSFSKQSSMSASRMEVSSKDFHGDGIFMNGDIDIIRSNSELWSTMQSGFSEPVEHNPFALGFNDTSLLSRFSSLDKFLFRSGLSFDGGVGSIREQKAIFLAQLLHSQSISMSSGPSWDTMLTKDFINSNFIDTNGQSYLKSRLASNISADNGIFVDKTSFFEAELSQLTMNSCLSDSKIISELLDGYSGEIVPLKIIGIERFDYTGHVYDLHTMTSSYWAEGILSSNCRGTFVPHFGLGAYRPKHRDMPVSVSVGKFENAPIEFIPWLRGIGKKTIFDKIIFTPLPGNMESKVEKNILFIDPQDEEDPRDVILHREGELLYPIFRESFHEMETLSKAGVIHPEKSHDTPAEHFIHLYQAYRLHQIDDPILMAWFSSNLH